MAEQKPKKKPRGLQHYDIKPGDNRHMLEYNQKLFNLPPINRRSAEEVMQRSEEYISITAEYDQKPSMASYALALGVSTQTVYEYENAINTTPEVAEIVRRMAQIMESMLVGYFQTGNINPVTAIFLLKSNYGYKETQEVVHKIQTPFSLGVSEKELEKRYLESVAEDKPVIETTAELVDDSVPNE